MTLTASGWVWRVVNRHGVAHLVPPDVRRLSRSACGRHPVQGAHLSEPPKGLFGEIDRCAGCRRADGDES